MVYIARVANVQQKVGLCFVVCFSCEVLANAKLNAEYVKELLGRYYRCCLLCGLTGAKLCM